MLDAIETVSQVYDYALAATEKQGRIIVVSSLFMLRAIIGQRLDQLY